MNKKRESNTKNPAGFAPPLNFYAMIKNVKTRKQLEQQGFARIESNFGNGWCYLDESFKWVLIMNDDEFVFKQEGNTIVPGQTIKDLIDTYNDGIVTFKEFYNE